MTNAIMLVCLIASALWLVKAEMGRRNSSFVTTPALSQASEISWAVTLGFFAINTPGALPLVLALAALFHAFGALVKAISYEPPPYWWPQKWKWFKNGNTPRATR